MHFIFTVYSIVSCTLTFIYMYMLMLNCYDNLFHLLFHILNLILLFFGLTSHTLCIKTERGQVQAIVPSGGQISSLYIFNKLCLILKLKL